MDFYLTETRLALLRAAADGYVFWDRGFIGYYDGSNGFPPRKVSALFNQLHRAGWLQTGRETARRRYYIPSPAGRAVLDAHGEAS